MKRAFTEEHQFDEDAMPCLCEVCNGWFDLEDGAEHPRKPNITICEGCADDIQKEVDKEEEIEELQNQISDAEYTIKDCKEQLTRLIPAKQEESKEELWAIVAGIFYRADITPQQKIEFLQSQYTITRKL
jgi:hypothetical protein